MKTNEKGQFVPELHEYNGEWKTLKEWAEKFGMKKSTLKSRLFKGKLLREALETPIGFFIGRNGKSK